MYSFWIDAILKYSNINGIKSQQVNLLRDLMNAFSVYKNISRSKKKLNHEAEDLYLMLLGMNATKKFTHRQKCCLISGKEFLKNLSIRKL